VSLAGGDDGGLIPCAPRAQRTPRLPPADAPTLAGTLSATYNEASDFTTGVALFSAGVAAADADDTSVTTAKVVIKTTAWTDVYGACDTMRDVLELPATYSSSPAVTGVWSPAICTLLLRPVMGTTVTLADMSAALGAVRYRNNNQTDPAAMQTAEWKLIRRVEAYVTDNAANAQAGAPATSIALTGNVTLVTVDGKSEGPPPHPFPCPRTHISGFAALSAQTHHW